jgi:hypothetical protein
MPAAPSLHAFLHQCQTKCEQKTERSRQFVSVGEQKAQQPDSGTPGEYCAGYCVQFLLVSASQTKPYKKEPYCSSLLAAASKLAMHAGQCRKTAEKRTHKLRNG